jgi:hypothetical protein
MGKTKLPTHIDIYASEVGLAKDSVILLEQIRTLDKRRLKEKMGHLDESVMGRVDGAIAVSFGLEGANEIREANRRVYTGHEEEKHKEKVEKEEKATSIEANAEKES